MLILGNKPLDGLKIWEIPGEGEFEIGYLFQRTDD
jgi:hypothetical protein